MTNNSAKVPDLLKDDPKKLFRRYLIPSVSATMVTSVYIIVDTVMIGYGIGEDALVALNLILPVFSVLFALGMLFGVGGGVLFSVARGAGDDERASAAFSTAIAAVFSACVLTTVLFSIFLRPLGFLLGADEQNIGLVLQYGRYVAHYGFVFTLSSCLQAFVRNDRDPKRAMAAVLSGAVFNTAFDYIFIFKLHMGMGGASLASILGTALTAAIAATHFLSKRNSLKFNYRLISFSMLGKIIISGLPTFFIEMAGGVVTFSFNRQILRYISTAAVVIYSVIANCAIVCTSLFNGISQAAQPVIAANYGAKQLDRVRIVQRLGLIIVFIIAVACASTAYFMPNTLVQIFVPANDALLVQAKPILRTYFLAFIPMGMNLFLGGYFQSIVAAAPALATALFRGVFLPITLVLMLPALFGGSTIWFVMPLTETITLIMALLLGKRFVPGLLTPKTNAG